MSKLTRAALCFALASVSAEGEALPATLTLIPAPDASGWVQGVDGRRFKVDAAAVVAAFNRKLPIDENHATHLAAQSGMAAPAFGWVKALREEGGAVVGEIAWNKRGAAAVADGEYGYLSPAFDVDDSTSRVLRLLSVGLTNDPNFPQLALNRAHLTAAEEAPVMSKAIALALGLAEAATETEIVVAINAVKGKAATPDLAQFVPRADHQLALNRAETAEKALADQKKAQVAAEVETAISGALAAGKITPASADYHRAVCAQEGGLEKFKAFVAGAPVVAAPGTPASALPGSEISLNATEKECAVALGISEADYLAEKKRLAAAKPATA